MGPFLDAHLSYIGPMSDTVLDNIMENARACIESGNYTVTQFNTQAFRLHVGGSSPKTKLKRGSGSRSSPQKRATRKKRSAPDSGGYPKKRKKSSARASEGDNTRGRPLEDQNAGSDEVVSAPASTKRVPGLGSKEIAKDTSASASYSENAPKTAVKSVNDASSSPKRMEKQESEKREAEKPRQQLIKRRKKKMKLSVLLWSASGLQLLRSRLGGKRRARKLRRGFQMPTSMLYGRNLKML